MTNLCGEQYCYACFRHRAAVGFVKIPNTTRAVCSKCATEKMTLRGRKAAAARKRWRVLHDAVRTVDEINTETFRRWREQGIV